MKPEPETDREREIWNLALVCAQADVAVQGPAIDWERSWTKFESMKYKTDRYTPDPSALKDAVHAPR